MRVGVKVRGKEDLHTNKSSYWIYFLNVVRGKSNIQHKKIELRCHCILKILASGKYSQHFIFSTFCYVKALFQKHERNYFPQTCTHNTPWWQRGKVYFEIFCKYITKKKTATKNSHVQVLKAFDLKLKFELRCIFFPLLIFEMFLQLDWSSLVVNPVDWTWFGKVSQLTVFVRAQTQEWSQKNCQ